MENFRFTVVQPATICNVGILDIEAESLEDAIRILKENRENGDDLEDIDGAFSFRFDFNTYEDDDDMRIYDYETGEQINLQNKNL